MKTESCLFLCAVLCLPVSALERPDMRERMLAEGNEAVGNAPGEFAAVIRTDIAKYAKIVKAANIKAD